MSPDELIARCRAAAAQSPVGVVVLVQPGYANHDHATLGGLGRGPRGRVYGPGPTDGTQVVAYPAARLLAFLERAHGIGGSPGPQATPNIG